MSSSARQNPRQYGDSFADVYDDWYGSLDALDAIGDALVAIAPGHRLVELGVGTGRIALPLTERGFDVVGIDASMPMLKLLATKPESTNGHSPRPVAADMARLPLRAASCDIVLIAYNTLFNLIDDGAQHRCLTDVAAILRPGGKLVIDAYVPAPAPVSRRHGVSRARRSDDQVVLIATRQEGRSSIVEGTHLQFTRQGMTVRPWQIRTQSPDEIDAMAVSVGLHCDQRWSGWNQAPFVPPAGRHVSVYTRPA